LCQKGGVGKTTFVVNLPRFTTKVVLPTPPFWHNIVRTFT